MRVVKSFIMSRLAFVCGTGQANHGNPSLDSVLWEKPLLHLTVSQGATEVQSEHTCAMEIT